MVYPRLAKCLSGISLNSVNLILSGIYLMKDQVVEFVFPLLQLLSVQFVFEVNFFPHADNFRIVCWVGDFGIDFSL